MDTLTRAMRDAADDAPTTLDVADEQWVESSWRSGRRRRAVRGVAAGAGLAAAAAVVVSLVVSGIGGMPSASVPADGSSRSGRVGVSSYPQRIGHQWWVRDLPDRPGPVAGLLEEAYQDGDLGTTWEVVGPRGTRYVTPHLTGRNDAYPVLSDDGTRVATLSPTSGGERLIVHDLVTGRKVTAPEVGPQVEGGVRFQVAGQSPGFFSPVTGRLALLVANPDPSVTDRVVVIDSETGAATGVPVMKQAAGWLDDDHLVGRTFSDDALVPADDRRPEIVVWDARSGRTQSLGRAEVPDPGPGLTASLRGQWWGALRSDGTLWLTVDVYRSGVEGSSPAQWLLGYDVPSLRRVGLDGRPATTPAPVELHEQDAAEQQQWRGTTPLSNGGSQPPQLTPVGRPDDHLVVIQESVPVTQVTWAQDAIDGSPSWAPFGTSTFALFWWWKEIVLTVLALAGWRWWVVRRRRRAVAR